MISVGDRIIMRQVKDSEQVELSGIVVLAIDLGHGDWALSVWDGFEEGVANYECGCVSEFGIDVVESGCKFNAIPKKIADVLERSAQLAKEELANSSASDSFRHRADLMRPSLLRTAMPSAVRQIVKNFREQKPEFDLSLPENKAVFDHFIISTIKQSIGKVASINVMQAQLCVWQDEFDKAVREAQP